jgi:hypothetical protein
MDDLGPLTKSLWAITAIVQILLLYLLVARRNVKTYPAFSAYIFMTLAQSGLLFVTIRGWGFSSGMSWRIGWATQCLVMTARAFAVAELCRHVLGRFRGVWLLARWILLVCGAGVLVYALLAASHQLRLMPNTAELGLEMATAAVIVTLLLFARYYDINVASQLRSIAIGLCVYSCVSVVNDAILERWLSRYVSLWIQSGMVAFLACLLAWGWAFRKLAPQTVGDPTFLDRSVYLNIIPEVNWRMRSLNEQLIRFWRVEAPRT